MKSRPYKTITGRAIDLSDLTAKERAFAQEAFAKFKSEPEWGSFVGWWGPRFVKAGLKKDSKIYRVCQDLEARLGISQGKVAPPDYRDSLADLIEAAYGSRYKFCKQTGFDPGQLSRVLNRQGDLSIQSLNEILKKVHGALMVVPEEDIRNQAGIEDMDRLLAAVD